MTHDTTSDKIEAWLSGELSEAEARAFEAEIAADADLAAKVRQHRIARRTIDRLVEQDFERNIVKWRETMGDLPEPPPAPFWKWWMTIPLVLIAALTVWYFIQEPNRETTSVQPEQEITQPKQDSIVPIDSTPPPVNPAPSNTKSPPPLPKPALPSPYIALVERNLQGLRDNISLKYDQTMGEQGKGSDLFEAGWKAFKSNDPQTAINNLLKIRADDPNFTAAQELLALSYFQAKDYPAAVRCYEAFAARRPYPEVDWRLAQFYLADYPNRKNDFWRKMDEILDPEGQHYHQKDAVNLKKALQSQGITKE